MIDRFEKRIFQLRLVAIVVGMVVLTPMTARAEVKLPKVFSDHMVLQRNINVPVWGTAAPGEKVTVAFRDQTVSAVTDKDGRWRVALKPLQAGGPFELAVTGKNTVKFVDVMVGEVWFCSGQSNMTVMLKETQNAQAEIAKAENSNIRMFHLCYNFDHLKNRPQYDFPGQGYGWVLCTPKTAEIFSAIGYYFGQNVQQSLNVPVGLIHSSWGGTTIQTWCPREVLAQFPQTKKFMEDWDQVWKDFAAGKRSDPQKGDFGWVINQAAGLYNGAVVPFIPYAIRGVIWYQGEGNTPEAYFYRRLFPATIQGWRKAWGQGDFPFLFVQLANYTARAPQPGESDWAELREAQLMTLSTPNTGMAVTIDIGDAQNIHPTNKKDVGRRLALAAQAVAYGQKIEYSGPIYKSMKIEGGKIRLSFDHLGGGLVAKGDKLTGFAIAGPDKKFVWADAKIDGDIVVVWSDKVAKPVAVRYAWAHNPECNLYNKAGLPASPFRTDDWPGITKR